MKRAILWDMDGTLADSEHLHQRSFITSLAHEGLEAPNDLESWVLGKSEDTVYRQFSEKLGIDLPFSEWIALRERSFAALEQEIKPRGTMDRRVRDLARRGVIQAIVSNSQRSTLDTTIRALGLRELELLSVSRSDVSEGKPNPEGYLKAANTLGVEPHDALVVEDTPTGVKAGLRAGMTVIFYPQDGMNKNTRGKVANPATGSGTHLSGSGNIVLEGAERIAEEDELWVRLETFLNR